MKPKFFEFVSSDKKIEDYCQAPNLEFAKEVFNKYYKEAAGTIKEIFMKDWDPDKIKKYGNRR